jgi:molybdate transport system permease protein
MRRAALAGLVFAAAFATLGFLVLPVVAIFTHVSPGRLVHQLSNAAVTDALLVSLKTSAIAQALVLALGTPTAYLLAARRFPGRGFLVTLVELPLVLPPAVAGLGLLTAFGRMGLLHTGLPFTQAAVVVAVAFVGGPLYVRAAIAAFGAVDANLVAASRTLGAGPAKTFFRVVLPLARDGLAAGEALSFARGLGEFGATIMFAGSLQGVTQTLPLAVYAEFDVNFDTALAVSGLLVLISAALLVTLKWLASSSTSASRFALSTSS